MAVHVVRANWEARAPASEAVSDRSFMGWTAVKGHAEIGLNSRLASRNLSSWIE